MAKEKTIFFCKECGTEVSKWQGQCPGCHQWNTLVEASSVTGGKKAARSRGTALSDNRPEKINEIETQQETRRETGMKELDRVLGGGIVPGSLILVGGDPGIGKSTLLLQTCRLLSQKEEKGSVILQILCTCCRRLPWEVFSAGWMKYSQPLW